jgi:ABC-type spermidine/putrescine transport system permease subunit I
MNGNTLEKLGRRHHFFVPIPIGNLKDTHLLNLSTAISAIMCYSSLKSIVFILNVFNFEVEKPIYQALSKLGCLPVSTFKRIPNSLQAIQLISGLGI